MNVLFQPYNPCCCRSSSSSPNFSKTFTAAENGEFHRRRKLFQFKRRRKLFLKIIMVMKGQESNQFLNKPPIQILRGTLVEILNCSLKFSFLFFKLFDHLFCLDNKLMITSMAAHRKNYKTNLFASKLIFKLQFHKEYS